MKQCRRQGQHMFRLLRPRKHLEKLVPKPGMRQSMGKAPKTENATAKGATEKNNFPSPVHTNTEHIPANEQKGFFSKLTTQLGKVFGSTADKLDNKYDGHLVKTEPKKFNEVKGQYQAYTKEFAKLENDMKIAWQSDPVKAKDIGKKIDQLEKNFKVAKFFRTE